MSVPNSALGPHQPHHHILLNLVSSYYNTPVGRPVLEASDVALCGQEAASLPVGTLDSLEPYSILFSITARSLRPAPCKCQVPPTREVSRGESTAWASRAHQISGSTGRGRRRSGALGGLQLRQQLQH